MAKQKKQKKIAMKKVKKGKVVAKLMKHNFDKLYKLTATGAIQQWEIGVERRNEEGSEIAVIVSEYGQVDGKIQTAEEIVRTGKNIGRANETDVMEQAILQAESSWKKKQDKGYVTDIKKVLTGGKNADVRPMLAHKYEDKAHTISKGQMVYLQPKLDGVRAIAKMIDGEVSLYSRNGKFITAVPHINEELKLCMEEGDIWDGELYHTELEFNEITSLVKTKKPKEESEIIEYHIFDSVVTDKNYYDRHLCWVDEVDSDDLGIVQLVPTALIEFSEEVLDQYHDEWVAEGYEGAMIRIQDDPGYQQKRTSNLLKYKKFMDDEFVIVSYEEGTPGTKLDGHLAAFYLEIDSESPPYYIDENGDIHDAKHYDPQPGDKGAFKAKPDGPQATLKRVWEERDEWLGKVVRVKFQNYSKYGNPRFPVVQGLRWEGDLD